MSACLPFRSATELVAALGRGETSSSELLELYIERYERFNPQLNAIVDTDLEGARARARQADQAREKGESLGALHGLPMTLKDSIEIRGMRTTHGSPTFKDYRSVRDADVVESLQGAGAVIFGKTNLPLFGNDFQTFNEVYGTTNNPWNLELSPGGSSGGAAAAVAAGLTGLEIGSDIGGSIRSPAHYCGVYGHKPSFGIVPYFGQLPPSKHHVHDHMVPLDLVVTGPLGRSAEDLAMVMDLVVRPARGDRKAFRIELPPARKKSLKDYRIGVWIDDGDYGPDSSVGDALQHAVDALARAGAQVVDKRPDLDFRRCYQVYSELLNLATAHTLPEDQFKQLQELTRQPDADQEHPIVKYAHMKTRTHGEWLRLNGQRAMMRTRWEEYFQDVDVMICPCARVAAFPHDPRSFTKRVNTVNGQELPHDEVLLPWAGLTLMAYLPATSAPVGLTPDGRPVGAQIVGPYHEDRTPIHVAQLMQDVVGGYTPPPGYE